MARVSLTKKFVAILLGLLSLWVLDFGALYRIEAKHHHVDDQVAAVGRLRMLAQRIGYRTTLATTGPVASRAEVTEMLDTWERGLAALERGGPLFGIDVSAPDAGQLARLAVVRTRWQAWREDIHARLAAAADPGQGAGLDARQETGADKGRLVRIAQGADDLVDGIDALLHETTHRVEREERSAWSALVALIAVNLVCVLAGLLALHKRMVVPLRDLVGLSREYADGRFDRRMDFASGDEIGDLAHAFNRMADTTLADLARLRKMSQAVEHSSASVVITDTDGVIEYVNPRFSELTGYAAAEAIGANPRILRSGQTPATVYAEMWAALGAGREWRGELLNRRKTGELIWVLQSMSCVRDAAGRISHYVAVGSDMTEHRRVLHDLSRVNRMLRLLSSCNEALIHAQDEAGIVEAICRQIVDLGGYRGAAVVAPASGEAAPRLLGHAGTIPACAEASGLPSLTLPLAADRQTLGELRICLDGPDPLPDEERRLLNELANDLAFGMATLRVAAARHSAEEAVRLRDRAIESSLNGLMIAELGAAGPALTYVNRAFMRMTGYRADEVYGRHPGFLLSASNNDLGYAAIRAALEEHGEERAELRLLRRDGKSFWAEVFVSPVMDAANAVTHLLIVCNDISERIAYETELAHRAKFDVLTGLANRNLLMDRIGQAVAQARRHAQLAAVIALNLDHFRYINDGLGQGQGDQLLREIAHRLAGYVRQGDTVARAAADEFVVVLAETANEGYVSEVLDRLQKLVAAPVVVAGQDVLVTCSLGVAMFPRDGDDAEALLKNANAAMHRAKQLGRNQFQFCTAELNRAVAERLAMDRDLRRAIQAEQLCLHYQPQVDLKSGKLVGVEALVRWQHPEHGLLAPSRFVPLAEETGLIVPLGEWVLDAACAQASAWRRQGLPVVTVAVNLSAHQFRQKNLVQMVRQILLVNELEPERLEIEVTESMVMADAEQAAGILAELKDLGVKLALDDFGTGYSSLAYLKRFPIDNLKLDRSFVRDLPDDPEDAAIVRTVMSLARSLDLKVVAEGVENAAQLRFMAAQRCDFVQGYYFSKPVPPEELTTMLRAGKELTASHRIGRAAILVVDADARARDELAALLASRGFAVSVAASVGAAVEILERQPVNMVIADQSLAGMTVADFMAYLRGRWPGILRVLVAAEGDAALLADAVNRGAVFKFVAKPWQTGAMIDIVTEGLGALTEWPA